MLERGNKNKHGTFWEQLTQNVPFFNNYCQNIIDNLNISAIMYLVDLCTLEGIR